MSDRIDRALKRIHKRELQNTTVEVFEPSESYTAGEGFDVTYPDVPDNKLDVRLSSPSANTDRDPGGTTGEIGAQISVPDDVDQQFTDMTDEEEAPVELRDTADGTRYEVEAVTDPHNGLLRLDVTEIS
jgi:hypothetical protein